MPQPSSPDWRTSIWENFDKRWRCWSKGQRRKPGSGPTFPILCQTEKQFFKIFIWMILTMKLMNLPQEWMRGKCRRRSSRTCYQWTRPPNGPRFLVPWCASSPSDVAPFHGPLTWPSWMRRRRMIKSWKVGKGWRWPWKKCHKRSTEKETVASRFPAAVGAPSDSGWWLVQLDPAGKWIRTWSTSDQLSDWCEAWASWTDHEWVWWCRFCNCPFCVIVK